ncbi:MAG: hypothetical protein ACREGC_00060 [Minisyncoccia bacterium]
MEISVSVHDWLAIAMPTRLKLREIFNIPKSRGSLVEGNVVKSDGTTYEDLKHITIEKMQTYLGVNTKDFIKLFNSCVEKIEEQDKELEPKEPQPSPNAIVLENWADHLSRMQRESESLGLQEHFQTLLTKFIPNDGHNNPPKREREQSPAKTPAKRASTKAKAKGA